MGISAVFSSMSRCANFRLLPSKENQTTKRSLLIFSCLALQELCSHRRSQEVSLAKPWEPFCNGSRKEPYQAAKSPGYRDGISHTMSNEDALLSCSFCLWVLFLWASWMFTCHMAFLPSESTEANVGGDLNHVILGLWCSPTVCVSQMGVLHYPLYLATEAIKPLSQAPSPHYRVVRCQELQKWVVCAL